MQVEYFIVWTETVEHSTGPKTTLGDAAKELESVKKEFNPDKVWIEKHTLRQEKMTDAAIRKATADRKTPRERQSETNQER